MGLTFRKNKLIIHSIVLLLVGGGLLLALLRVIGVEETVARLHSVDLTLLGVALLLFCSQAITMAVRWWLALRMCGHQVSLVSCIRANSAANVINFLAPGHFGEPAATAWLGKTGRGPGVEAFAVLIACKAIATVLNLVLLLACIALLAAGTQSDFLGETIAIAALSFFFAGSVFFCILHPGVAAWGTRTAGKLTRSLTGWIDRRRASGGPHEGEDSSRSEQLGRRIESIFERFRAAFVVFSQRPRVLAVVTAVSCLKVASLIGGLYFTYRALGLEVSVTRSCFIQAMDSLGNLASIWIPLNLGVQEIVHTSAASGFLAIDAGIALSASLLVKLFVIVYTIGSALLWICLAPFDRLALPATGTEGGGQDDSSPPGAADELGLEAPATEAPPSPVPVTKDRPTGRGWLLALLVVGACLVIIQSRPYDGALFRGADTGSQWAEHGVRTEAEAIPPSLHSEGLRSWIRKLDAQYPPFLHVATILLSPIVGRSAEATCRSMVLWFLFLGLSVGLCGFALTDSRRLALLAAAGALTTPALASAALSYYYDLPMTALVWGSTACILLGRKRLPVLFGVAAGLLFAMACLTKWSAVPQGLSLILGALLLCRVDERWNRRLFFNRAQLLGSAALVAGLGLLWFNRLSTASWSEMVVITTGRQVDVTQVEHFLSLLIVPSVERLAFYPARFFTTLFSPLLAILLVFALVVWFKKHRHGAVFFGLALLGNLSFLLLVVPPTDTRFLFPLAPLFLLAGVLGLDRMGPLARKRVVTAWAVLSLLVIWDVHHGHPNPLNHTWKLGEEGLFRGRGLALDSGDATAGWIRADQAASSDLFYPDREALFSRLLDCEAETLLVDEGVLRGPSDATWWNYRNFLERSRTPEGGFRQLATWKDIESNGGLHNYGIEDRKALAINRSVGEDTQPPTFDDWTSVGTFESESTHPVAIWAMAGSGLCRE